MGDLATVQQLAERVSQMGYPVLLTSRIELDEGFHHNLSSLELEVLEEFLTACFNARHELKEAIGGYTLENLEEARRNAYDEGYNEGAKASEGDLDEAYDRGYEYGKCSPFRDED